MKKIFLLLVLMTQVLLVGCVNNMTSSGDKPIREDIVSMSLPNQRAYVVSLTPEQRYELWKYKLEDTLTSMSLTKEEKAVISPLYKSLCVDSFTSGTEQYDLFAIMCTDVNKSLRDQFGWDDLKMFRFLETVMTEKEITVFNERLPEGSRKL